MFPTIAPLGKFPTIRKAMLNLYSHASSTVLNFHARSLDMNHFLHEARAGFSSHKNNFSRGEWNEESDNLQGVHIRSCCDWREHFANGDYRGNAPVFTWVLFHAHALWKSSKRSAHQHKRD